MGTSRNKLFTLLIPLVTLAVTLALSACTGRTVHRETDETRSMETTLITNPHEAKLERGRQAAAKGDFDLAIQHYLAVYRDGDAKPEYKERALLRLGGAHSDLLNPKKDYQKALKYLEDLVSTYPTSKLRKDAEERIEVIKKLLGDDDS
jgi:outer membrane protein assembly factor BamD (BamD/ComL family)